MNAKTTPQAALEQIKALVLSAPSSSEFIDEEALRLSGEPQDRIDRGIKAIGDEVFEGLHSQPLSHAKRFAMTLATCSLIRERIAAMQKNGRGNA
ncbi:MAG: hypothetical protein ACXW3J_07545 [Methylocystis sp.]